MLTRANDGRIVRPRLPLSYRRFGSALGLALLLALSPGVRGAALAEQAQPPSKTSVAATAANTREERFFQTYGVNAVESMLITGVPASVTLAQAALESGWGESLLTRDAHNFFGIKAYGKTGSAGVVWMKTWEVVDGEDVIIEEPFRAYASDADSFTDHGWFFWENSRYATALAQRGDAKAFAVEVARAGYATDPIYADKVISLMNRYDLYRFDTWAYEIAFGPKETWGTAAAAAQPASNQAVDPEPSSDLAPADATAAEADATDPAPEDAASTPVPDVAIADDPSSPELLAAESAPASSVPEDLDSVMSVAVEATSRESLALEAAPVGPALILPPPEAMQAAGASPPATPPGQGAWWENLLALVASWRFW
jgi:hypothetical protein